MADTTFVDYTTVVTADWLNDVNDLVYGIQSSTSTSDGDALVALKRTSTGAIATTLHAANEKESFDAAKWFGMSPSETAAANTTALQAAIAAANAAGGGVVTIPAGTYALTAGTNFATARVGIVGIGQVIFDYSAGTGVGFKLDAGGSGAVIKSMRIENIIFKGGPSITDIFYLRGIVASQFTNLQAREGTDTGFKLLFSVLNTFKDCRVSNDNLAMTTSPTNYWYLNDDGTGGNRSQANTFINCDASGKGATSTSTGWCLIDSTLNQWYGGTAESMAIGVDIQNSQCRNNSWYGFDLEDNQTNDVKVKGFANAFYTSAANSSSSGNTIDVLADATNTMFVGGYMRLVNLNASSANTFFVGTHFEDNASLGIQGTGTYKCIGCTEGNGYSTAAPIDDVLGASSTWTPTVTQSGSVTVTVNSAEYTKIGKMVNLRGKLTVTGSGTAANNIVIGGIPAGLAMKASINTYSIPIGHGSVLDNGTAYYTGLAIPASTTSFTLQAHNVASPIGTTPNFGLAATDIIFFDLKYEVA